MEETTVLNRVPTDSELKEAIAEKEQEIKFLKNLLKLNDAGREQALIYMLGLTHLRSTENQLVIIVTSKP